MLRLIFFSFLLFIPNYLLAQSDIYLKGVVCDEQNQPLEMVQIVLNKKGIGTLTQKGGEFLLPYINAGEHDIYVHMMGYEVKKIHLTIQQSSLMDTIRLKALSLELEEVTVVADHQTNINSQSNLDRQALEHLQPTGFNEVMSLLPGGIVSDPSLSNPQQIALRQAGGSDVNTAFGTAIIVDGQVQTNDANLQKIRGASSGYDTKVGGNKTTIYGGFDLRQISVDQIESIEVVRGIPSVRYGNLTSGLVNISTKTGESPFEIRLKKDVANTLGAIRKGFTLPKKWGTIHLSSDILSSKNGLVRPTQYYRRFSNRINYNKLFENNGSPIRLDLSVSNAYQTDQSKEDPEALVKGEYYSLVQNNINTSLGLKWFTNKRNLKLISFHSGIQYQKQEEDRVRVVSSNLPVPLPVANEEGYHQGVFLPSEYSSTYSIQGRPVNFSTKMMGEWLLGTDRFQHQIVAGSDFSYIKNYGDGVIYDIYSPPYPRSSSSSRPRAFHEVPASKTLSFFLEDKWNIALGNRSLSIQTGLRVSKFFMDEKYRNLQKLFIEPRVNMSYPILDKEGGILSNISWRIGFGQHSKMPSLADLYPEKIYFDMISLNYFSQIEENNLLWMKTEIEDPTNYELKASINTKYETGFDFQTSVGNGFITIFYENMENGFGSNPNYLFYDFKKYDPTSVSNHNVKPKVDDFNYEMAQQIMVYSESRNNQGLEKWGIEYNYNSPKIPFLNTSFNISGAYFYTKYHKNDLAYYRPSVSIGDSPYPYIGIYENNQSSNNKAYERFNTNIRSITHIPELKLVITLLFQNIWYTKTTYTSFTGIPIAYYNEFGDIIPFDKEMIEDPIFQHLNQSRNENFFRTDTVPMVTDINLNITWEASKNLTFAFIANRILGYYPSYIDNYERTIRRDYSSYFGTELRFKF